MMASTPMKNMVIIIKETPEVSTICFSYGKPIGVRRRLPNGTETVLNVDHDFSATTRKHRDLFLGLEGTPKENQDKVTKLIKSGRIIVVPDMGEW